jgi:selenocysteine lyase/cysteine desulfurase
VGECYPFSDKSQLVLTFDNHNSVNGLREYAKRKGACTTYLPVMIENLRIDEHKIAEALDAHPDGKNKLLAYPAQSNVSGVKHGLKWVKYAQERGWDVLLDAAAYVPTNRLDLQKVPANFVSISFYKIFGYPTGLGCLLMRKDSFEKMHKPWFAGGTVSLVSVLADDYILVNNHERYEDGTVNYLDIPAIKIGLEHVKDVGIETIQLRVSCLTGWLIQELDNLKHGNGNPVVKISGPVTNEDRGGTIIMNFFDKDGNKLPFFEVEKQANERKISLRTGCFCNPGIDELNSHLSPETLGKYFTSRDAKSSKEILESVGVMRGAIRISFGLASNFADAERFMNFAKGFVEE